MTATQEISPARAYESENMGKLKTRGAALAKAGPQISTCLRGTDTMESTRPASVHAPLALTVEQAAVFSMGLAALTSHRPDVAKRHAATITECCELVNHAVEAAS